MHRPLVVLLASVLFVIGCSGEEAGFAVEERDGVPHALNRGTNVWTDSAAAPLQFKHEQTYGTNDEPTEALLANVRSIAVDEDDVVYVLDRGNHRLVAFNPDGTVRWTAGREGEGPGEFQNPRGMVLGDDARLYVGNERARHIDVWTTEGSFQERHTFREGAMGFPDFVGYAEGQIYVSEMSRSGDPQQFHAIDPETWSRTHSFSVDLPLELPERLGTRAQATTLGDRLFVSYITEYTLDEYTLDGTLSRRIQRDVDSLTGPGFYQSGSSRGISTGYSELSPPIQLEEGHFLVRAYWPTNVDDPHDHLRRRRNDNADDPVHASALDLFEENGRYVGSLRWKERSTPPIGRPQVVGPDGKLYTTTTEPFPQVRRYEVTVEGE